MKTVLWLSIVATSVYGCSCVHGGSACSGIGGDTVVFLAKVAAGSGQGWGIRPGHVVIEEPLYNVPNDLHETDVQVAQGTSCYYPLRAGERYVIYAARDPRTGTLSTNVCSHNFNVRGKENVLHALERQARGEPSSLVGTIERSTGRYSHEGAVPRAKVVISSGEQRFETYADEFGNYEFLAIPSGLYRFELEHLGFVPDEEFNHRWNGVLRLNRNGVISPSEQDKGVVTIAAKSCEVWDLAMWPNGRILGAVHNAGGEPIADATVQAFPFDKKAKRESEPLRTAISAADGSYMLDRLPGGAYIVGINAETYSDSSTYRPVEYSRDGTHSTRLMVEDAKDLTGIDLVVGAPRQKATLTVTVVFPVDEPLAIGAVSLENLVRVQRAFARLTSKSPVELPVFIGERYIVKASSYPLHGEARVDMSKENQSVTVFLTK
jgi:hypothetical protein